jgi:hypothetical protein
MSVQATLGDGAQAGKDVDLYRVDLAAGDVLRISMNASFYNHLRVFNAAGTALADQYLAPNGTAPLQFTAPAAGTYYVGVSGYLNAGYNPNQAGSGDDSGYTGTYQLTAERRSGDSTLLSGITASAARGTPAQGAVPSANVGQTITLSGSGLQPNEQVVFTAIDYNGNLYGSTVTAASVAANGSSLTVVVPNDATTGTVRLARDTVGLLLQVVPTLDTASINQGPFPGSQVTLTGSGFAEGESTIRFGAGSLADTSRQTGLDVYSSIKPNDSIFLQNLPSGVPAGPVQVTTPGGTSEAR